MSTLFDPTNPLEIPAIDPAKDYLAELVGEGKKFADPAALARAKAEADRHIQKLEREQAGIRAELEKRITMEELLTKISSQNKPAKEDPPSQDTTPGTDGDTPGQQLTPEQIQELVIKALDARDSRSQAQKNFDLVKDKCKEAFGDNYGEVLAKKAEELGVGSQFLDDLAKTQPNAFLKLVEANVPQKQTSDTNPMIPNLGSIIPNSGTVSEPGFKNQKFYLGLQKSDPKRFWDPKTQLEMHNMAMRNPAKYFAD